MHNYDRHSRSLRRGRRSVTSQIYFVTTNCRNRQRYFSSEKAAKALMCQIELCDIEGLTENYAYVVMPDHLHWLFSLNKIISLSDVIKRVKGRSAYVVNKLRNISGPFWQPGYHDHALRRHENLRSIGEYMLMNPVRAGLVDEPSKYPYKYSVWPTFDSRG